MDWTLPFMALLDYDIDTECANSTLIKYQSGAMEMILAYFTSDKWTQTLRLGVSGWS